MNGLSEVGPSCLSAFSLSAAPSDPLLCKFADGGPKKRQNQGKFVQNGRAWPRNGDMVRGPLGDENTGDVAGEWVGLPGSSAGGALLLPLQGRRVRPLAGELRSCMPKGECQERKQEWEFPWLDSWGRLESSSCK